MGLDRCESVELGWGAFVVGRLRRVLSAISIAVLLVGSSACAKPAPDPTLPLRVSNELGRTISELRKKPCGDLEMAFVPIEKSRIRSGEVRAIDLPRTCVDVVAFDARGRIVGEQRNLKMMPSASWVLRK